MYVAFGILSVLLVWLVDVCFWVYHLTCDSPEQRRVTGSPVLTTRAERLGLITGDAEPAKERKSEDV